MNITLTLGDFLAIGAIVIIFGRSASFSHDGLSPPVLRMQRQLDAIMRHLGLPEPSVSRPGALSPPVLALLAEGRKTDAIALYRRETGESVKQAQKAIESAKAEPHA